MTDAPWQPGPSEPRGAAPAWLPAGRPPGGSLTPPLPHTPPAPSTQPVPTRLPSGELVPQATPQPRVDPWQPEPWTEILPPPAPRTHRVAVVVLSVLLGLTLAGGAGLTWYLLRVNAAWQEHSQEWQDRAEQQAAELAQTRSDLESTRSELAAVQDQLSTAQDRITQLANEKAQLGDESAAQQQLADYQARISKAAGQVATALATCIDGQETLISYIEQSAQWDPASLASYKQNVEGYCADARSANAALQAELAQ